MPLSTLVETYLIITVHCVFLLQGVSFYSFIRPRDTCKIIVTRVRL